jgi:hypothetical protein
VSKKVLVLSAKHNDVLIPFEGSPAPWQGARGDEIAHRRVGIQTGPIQKLYSTILGTLGDGGPEWAAARRRAARGQGGGPAINDRFRHYAT